MPFDPLGIGYDYETARRIGLSVDETGHWPSRDPGTGLILKGADHPTFHKTLEGERAAGYEVYQDPETGRYYSRSMKQPLAAEDPVMQIDPTTLMETGWPLIGAHGTPMMGPAAPTAGGAMAAAPPMAPAAPMGLAPGPGGPPPMMGGGGGGFRNVMSRLGPVMAGLAGGNPLGGYALMERQRQNAVQNQLLMHQMRLAQQQRVKMQQAGIAAKNQLLVGLAPNVAEEMRKTLEPIAAASPETLVTAAMGKMYQKPTERTRFAREFLDMPPEQQAALKRAGVVGAPQTVIQMGEKLPTNYRWKDPTDPKKGVERIPGVRPSQDAIRQSAIGIENEALIDDFMAQLFTPEGEINAENFAQLQVPGSSLSNMLGTISQNETYLKSGAAAAEQEAKRIASGITPSLYQFLKGDSAKVRKQLERSRKLAGQFVMESEREEKAVTGPEPGTVDDGYIFVGGDPADSNNWVKQR